MDPNDATLDVWKCIWCSSDFKANNLCSFYVQDMSVDDSFRSGAEPGFGHVGGGGGVGRGASDDDHKYSTIGVKNSLGFFQLAKYSQTKTKGRLHYRAIL